MIQDEYKLPRHAPAHLFRSNAHYIVTAATHQKRPYLDNPSRKSILLETLLTEGERLAWRFEAWAILPNHYHFVAQAPDNARTLSKLLQAVHSKTAIALNRLDHTPGRKVWYQYWDTCITDDGAHHARLRYVHENPAKHGLVDDASTYPWCSMRSFLDNTTAEFRDQVLASTAQAPNIPDDF